MQAPNNSAMQAAGPFRRFALAGRAQATLARILQGPSPCAATACPTPSAHGTLQRELAALQTIPELTSTIKDYLDNVPLSCLLALTAARRRLVTREAMTADVQAPALPMAAGTRYISAATAINTDRAATLRTMDATTAPVCTTGPQSTTQVAPRKFASLTAQQSMLTKSQQRLGSAAGFTGKGMSAEHACDDRTPTLHRCAASTS